jgi:type IV pilus assembly protein PilA
VFADPAATVTPPSRLTRRLGPAQSDERGYSLIELLVVMLIIGVLAAIAIPSFINSKSKAVDVQAKELARTAETAAETVATANDGSYEKVTKSELHNAESSIPIAESKTDAYIGTVTSSRTDYSITAVATDGDEFTITKSSTGAITRACASPLTKKGCGGSASSSW